MPTHIPLKWVFNVLHAHINKRYQKKKIDLMNTRNVLCTSLRSTTFVALCKLLLLHAYTQPTSTIACLNTTKTNDLCYTKPKLECSSAHDHCLLFEMMNFKILDRLTYNTPKMFFTQNTPKTFGATCPRWLEFTLRFFFCSTYKPTLSFIL